MANGQSLDATFFAFRKREKSGVLMGASIGFAIGAAILLAIFGAVCWSLFGPLMSQLMNAAASGKGDPGAFANTPPTALGAIFWIFPLEFLFLFFICLLFAAYEAACLRWMIRGETGGGLFGLNLGADTWRVYATYWVWLGLFIAFYIVCLVLVVGVGASLFGGGGGGADAGAGGLIMFVLGLAILLSALYFGVRLAPAAATSVGRGRFSFFKALSVTSGRFWALLGAFVLLIVINIVVGAILSTLTFSFLFAGVFANLDMTTAATDPNAFMQAYFAGVMRLFSSPTGIAMMVVYQLVAGVVALVFYVLFFGVNARAVQAALEEGKIEVAPAT